MSGKTIINSTLNSYSQIFFSDNRLFAVILIIVSFIDYQAGLAGLISVITIIVFSNILSLNELETSKGLYGFNSLLVGLGLGNYFAFSPQLILIIIIASDGPGKSFLISASTGFTLTIFFSLTVFIQVLIDCSLLSTA